MVYEAHLNKAVYKINKNPHKSNENILKLTHTLKM